ncbi:hypothetical protein EZV62_013090 [Acer yangbiense]|uniref:Reverse transcriptase zinc-binding domain-containing protein n=1 Tax=Acer yangbiense TaxID=1000413 RepID=A0A5C7HX80_9ROSI|nr:hypothetical protein EZV62_013090 [Acer yangbiense]
MLMVGKISKKGPKAQSSLKMASGKSPRKHSPKTSSISPLHSPDPKSEGGSKAEIEKLYKQSGKLGNMNSIRLLEKEVEGLLECEEVYWKQRSRADWLGASDRNSKYFHAKATMSKKKNHISCLMDDSCRPQVSVEGMAGVVSSFFSKLFESLNPYPQDIRRAIAPIKSKCNGHYESTSHALFSCKAVRLVWNASRFGSLISPFRSLSVLDIFQSICAKVSPEDFQLFCVMVWAIWDDQNFLLNSSKFKDPILLVSWASDYLDEFQRSRIAFSRQSPPPTSREVVD